MEFDKSRVFTSLNADELKPGDKVIVADTMAELKMYVEQNVGALEIERIEPENCIGRFTTHDTNSWRVHFSLAYLVERKENCTNCDFCVCAERNWATDLGNERIYCCPRYKPKAEQKAENCTDQEELKFINPPVCDDRFEKIAEARKHIIEATNIEHSPDEMKVLDTFLFRCWQMGWLDRVEVEHSESRTEKEDNMWIDKIYPMRQENGVSDHVIVAVEGCPYAQSGYYDFDLQAWFVDGCSEPVKVEAWQKVELPKVEKAEPHYRPFKDTDELIKVWDAKYRDAYGLERIDRGLDMPHIWVRNNFTEGASLITHFWKAKDVGYKEGEESDYVTIDGEEVPVDDMLTYYSHDRDKDDGCPVGFTFLDGTPCGVEE